MPYQFGKGAATLSEYLDMIEELNTGKDMNDYMEGNVKAVQQIRDWIMKHNPEFLKESK